MLKCIAVLLACSAGFAQSDSLGLEEMISFSSTSLLIVDTVVDGYRYAPSTSKLKKVMVCYDYTGTSDTTLIDVKQIEGGSARSLLDSASSVFVIGGSASGCKTIDVSSGGEVQEGAPLRIDVVRVALGCPRRFTVSLLLDKGKRRQ